ncbi:unnamed protein product [Ilex paraguariensis]|uniref:Uncharacterized protein n=1 Tax=Ilex paraguariensis TaxID=185542 RepID=A0ABC8QZI1_9AQUA
MVKMLTTVLKFIVDTTSMDLVSHTQERCLKFALEYIEFIILHVKQYFHDQLHFKEEDFKDTFICLKSSFTYAAKLLNLVLKSSCQASPASREAYNLVNCLFDLIILVEELLGSGFAARLVSTAKPWMPDLILALTSSHLLKQTPGESTCSIMSDLGRASFPSWPSILAKLELCELSDTGSDEEADRVSKHKEFRAFRKFMGMLVQLLRADRNVLDAAGVIFLTVSIVGLEKKDFELLLGLLHFVCIKLVRHEDRKWGELNMMLASLGEIFPRIEREAEELKSSEDGRQKLQNAIALLQPVWMLYFHETRRDQMAEE